MISMLFKIYKFYSSKGGTKANKYEFPHQALIGYKKADTDNIEWFCGGSLISSNFVLTSMKII